MGIRTSTRNFIDIFLKMDGFQIMKSRTLYDWQKTPVYNPSFNEQSQLPADAKGYLKRDNPKFIELEQKYNDFDNQVTEPLVWQDEHVSDEDILWFRGDNAYVWQLRGPNMNELCYVLTTYYVKSRNVGGLYDKITEDNFFGNYTFEIDGKAISRDLLDSLLEIDFLDRHLGILSGDQDFNVLDIGAGYGRLAYRTSILVPNVKQYLSTDGVAKSTFICDYYLNYRGVTDIARAVPLFDIESELEKSSIELAINIHSFSECNHTAKDWWVSLLEKNKVRYLFVVPNSLDNGGEILKTNDRKEFQYILEKHGYQLKAKEPKYLDSLVQKYGINPTWHYLFELK